MFQQGWVMGARGGKDGGFKFLRGKLRYALGQLLALQV